MSDSKDKPKDTVELPAPTAAPLALGLGMALVGVGLATSLGFTLVGVVVLLFGLGSWIRQLVSVLGHVHEPMVEPSLRPGQTVAAPGTVEPMRPGTVGYRFNLPEKVHPISSGIKGGLIGGLLMPIPAMAYGMVAHASPWLPINLLVGIVIPGITDASLEDLKAFHLMSLILGIFIHAAFSVTFGLMYGVILPMLPSKKGGPLLFGGVLMPFLWTGVCYGMMGIVNPLMEQHVSWPWFVVSQLVYGLTMSYVVSRSEKISWRSRAGEMMKKATRWMALLVLLSGCDSPLPGKPNPKNKFVAPSKVVDFATLYAKNCAGCHGKDGKLGPAPPLNDAVFLAIASENELAKVIAGGRKGTEMPAFAKEQGGTLTTEQVQALAVGLYKKWGDAAAQKKTWPAYAVPAEKGDADRGKAVFTRVCAACHGQEGFGKEKQGPINDPAFLTLASEQVLRRFVITGRPDLGMPNCAAHEGGALTAPQVNDVVALLMSWKDKGTVKK